MPATPPASKSSRRRILRMGLIFLAALLLILVIDALRPLPLNPQQRYSGVIVDSSTDAVLRRACFDCHSNETRWAWYTRLPGVASLARRDVIKGREELNFSHWASMSPRRRAKALKESLESIREGEMAPWFYTLMHPDAVIDPPELAQLARAIGPLAAMAGSGEENSRDGHKDDDDDEKKGHRKKDDD